MKFIVALLPLICIGFARGKPKLFEGDIVLTDRTRKIVEGGNTYDAVASQARKWPGAVVPYVFDRYFDSYRRQVVQQAIQDFNTYTCIKFVPRTNQRNYVRFMIGGGCYSMIGVQGNSQDISIGNGCQYKGTVMHEMMHAVGFWHEQSRLDRDQYINIYWQNIQSSTSYNFQKYRHGEADYYGEPYDLDSLMHYHNTAFSANGQPTIAAKGNPSRRLGQRSGFSAIDKRQLNKLYNCQGGGGGTVKPPVTDGTGGGSCADNHSSCSYWASIGECQKNPGYMLVNCKSSCNKCLGGDCVDNHGSCASWAARGECQKNPGYMLVNCKKSCARC